MGMSTHINGYRPADDEWNRKKTAYAALKEAKIPIPKELERFFDYQDPTLLSGMCVDIKDAVKELDGNCSNIYEVDITKLPPGVRFIRFENSW